MRRRFFHASFFKLLFIVVLLSTFSPVALADTIFSDGFETGNLASWSTADTLWQVTSTSPHTGSNQAQVVGSSTVESVLSKNIGTAGFEDITLSYWYKILASQNLEEVDHLYVELSVDGGITWDATPLADYTNASTSGVWVEEVHVFPEVAENNANFAFRFRSDLSAGSNDQVRFDDVLLSGTPVVEVPIDVCPNIDGVQLEVPLAHHKEGEDCVANPIDLCPNIDGLQTLVPDNYHLEEGQCVLNPIDVCLNIDGIQTEILPNYHKEGDNCVPDPVDVCPNLDGLQTIVPIDFHLDNTQCVPNVVDLCPNIDGLQNPIPVGYHLESNQCLLDIVVPSVVNPGSITVCKIILDAKGNATTSSPGTTFVIPGLTPLPQTSQGAPVGEIPDTTFVTPLSFNKAIFGNTPDASCVTYNNLPLGGYYYGEEEITGDVSKWKKAKYNDETRWKVEDKYDLFLWSGELFDKKRWNDVERKLDSDGFIKLTKGRPERTLVVMNTEKPQPRFNSWGKSWSSWWPD